MRLFLVLFAVFAVWFLPEPAFANFPGAYVDTPKVADAALSPDGTKLVIVRRGETKTTTKRRFSTVEFYDTFSGELTRKEFKEFRYAYAASWATNNEVLLYVRDIERDGKKTKYQDKLIAFDPGAGSEREIFSTSLAKKFDDLETFAFYDMDRRSNKIAIRLDTDDGRMLSSVSFDGGEVQALEKGDDNTLNWILDENYDPVIKTERGKYKHLRNYYIKTDSGDWRNFRTVNRLDQRFSIVRQNAGENSVQVITRTADGNTEALHDLDLQTGLLSEPIFEKAGYDLHHVQIAKKDFRLLYAAWYEDSLERHWFDKEMEARAAGLDAQLDKDDYWKLIEASTDETVWLLWVQGPKNPGAYYVWNSVSKTLKHFADIRPVLKPEMIGDRTTIKYRADDGLELTGYLTNNKNVARKKGVIVMPHGGPVARDYLSWDGRAQFLASKGYYVFQPNFRGSGGFGRKFEELGHREWGRKMQTDIENGVDHLINENLIPRDLPFSMIGASYGGYAALMAAAPPYLYTCVASINGISDPAAHITELDENDPLEAYARQVWTKRIGNPETEPEFFEDITPLLKADKMHSKILLMHGDADEIVSVEQSRRMSQALKDDHHRHDYSEMPNVGHTSSLDYTNTRILTDVAAFLIACR